MKTKAVSTHTPSQPMTHGRPRDPRLSAPLPLRELQQHQVTVGIVATTTMHCQRVCLAPDMCCRGLVHGPSRTILWNCRRRV